MGLPSYSGSLVHTLFRCLGVSSVRATTDNPDACIDLAYKRWGVEHKTSFTVQELLDGIAQHSAGAHTEPPAGFTDVADLP